MNAREVLLAGLHRSDAGSTGEAPLPPLRAGLPRSGLTARFIRRAADAGAEVHLIGAAGLAEAVVRAVKDAPERDVVIWDDPLLVESADALRRSGIAVTSPEAEVRDAVASAGFGLTTADYAIAETGTIVLGCGPGRPRAVSLLPAHHLAVLPQGRIRTDLFDLIRDVRGPLPSALTFITGPSRTADIGLTPVRPAHGPTTVTIFVVSA